MSIKTIQEHIKDVPDFPKPGILFKDIMPLLKSHYNLTVNALSDLISDHEWSKIDAIAGIESRGFLLAGGLAAKKGKDIIAIRKKGRLPGPVEQVEYDLEYGKDALEMAPGSGRILLIDDVLATGGTLKAAAQLSEKTKHVISNIMVLINLKELNSFTWNGKQALSLLNY